RGGPSATPGRASVRRAARPVRGPPPPRGGRGRAAAWRAGRRCSCMPVKHLLSRLASSCRGDFSPWWADGGPGRLVPALAQPGACDASTPRSRRRPMSDALAALAAAVAAAPTSAPLRVHYASLLLAAGRSVEALEQAS